jgi:hypothetical protein
MNHILHFKYTAYSQKILHFQSHFILKAQPERTFNNAFLNTLCTIAQLSDLLVPELHDIADQLDIIIQNE